MATAPTGDVIRAWHGLGYNRRAIDLQRAARAIDDAMTIARVTRRNPLHENRVPRIVVLLVGSDRVQMFLRSA